MATLDIEWSSRPSGGMIDLENLKRRSWPGVAAYAVRIAAPVAYDFKLRSSANFVVLRDFYRVDGETRVTGLPPYTTKDVHNRLAYIPAGCVVEGWHQFDKAATIVVVAIGDPASKTETVDLADLPPCLEFEDALVRSLMLRFQALLDDTSLDTPGYVETLAELMTFELARTQGCQRPAQGGQSGLTPKQMRAVTEYMDNHLAKKTTVADFAALVDLTRFHFIRAFKQAAGVPPHQFMIRRRVERAKQLLAQQGASIGEIAERTGFGSPVQMSRAFRRIVGMTPSAFRESGR